MNRIGNELLHEQHHSFLVYQLLFSGVHRDVSSIAS
jgi:hypothetical protein